VRDRCPSVTEIEGERGLRDRARGHEPVRLRPASSARRRTRRSPHDPDTGGAALALGLVRRSLGDWPPRPAHARGGDPRDERDNALAVASVFKLYVLGALAHAIATKQLGWNDQLASQARWKSPTTGGMNWSGRRATGYDLEPELLVRAVRRNRPDRSHPPTSWSAGYRSATRAACRDRRAMGRKSQKTCHLATSFGLAKRRYLVLAVRVESPRAEVGPRLRTSCSRGRAAPCCARWSVSETATTETACPAELKRVWSFGSAPCQAPASRPLAPRSSRSSQPRREPRVPSAQARRQSVRSQAMRSIACDA
jgi:hypothetical protein